MMLKPSGSKQSRRHAKSKPRNKKQCLEDPERNTGKTLNGVKREVPAIRAGHHDEIIEITEPASMMQPANANQNGQELIIYDDHHGHHGHHGHDHIIVQQPQPQPQQQQGDIFLFNWHYVWKVNVWKEFLKNQTGSKLLPKLIPDLINAAF